VLSCLALAAQCDGRDVTTIEGLAKDQKLPQQMPNALAWCFGSVNVVVSSDSADGIKSAANAPARAAQTAARC